MLNPDLQKALRKNPLNFVTSVPLNEFQHQRMGVKFIQTLLVEDPDTGMSYELTVYKDTIADALFALDASYVDQVLENGDEFITPYGSKTIVTSEW